MRRETVKTSRLFSRGLGGKSDLHNKNMIGEKPKRKLVPELGACASNRSDGAKRRLVYGARNVAETHQERTGKKQRLGGPGESRRLHLRKGETGIGDGGHQATRGTKQKNAAPRNHAGGNSVAQRQGKAAYPQGVTSTVEKQYQARAVYEKRRWGAPRVWTRGTCGGGSLEKKKGSASNSLPHRRS